MTDQPTPADLLALAGRALYGEQWQAPMARLLDVSLRRIQYYAAKDRQPPPSMLHELAGHLDANAVECHDLAARLAARAQDSKP
jgi:hypothetical protein